MQEVLPILLIALALSTAVNIFLRRSNVPTVVGYIITGAVLGLFLHFDGHSQETLVHVAEFGVVFLMFTIGLEFSIAHLAEMKTEVLIFGFLQFLITSLLVGGSAYLFFGISPINSAIIGAAIAPSSTAIVHKILNESGKAKTAEGRNSSGILIFQDIAVIPVLLMITLVADDNSSILVAIGLLGVKGFLFVAAAFVFARYFLRGFFEIVSDTNSKEIYIGFVLLIVIGVPYISHGLGFSYSLGGFIAGMMISDTIYKYQIEADLIPFRDILLGVFFVSVGLQIDIHVVSAYLPAIAVLCLSLMVVKGGVLYLVLMGSQTRVVAFKTAVNLSQVGEFALVALSLMLGAKLMAPEYVQALMVTVVFSMIATPFLINHADTIIRFVFKGREQADAAQALSLVSGHVVLLGFGHLGQVISRQLDEADIPHVVLTDATDEYVKARELGKSVIFGDPGDRVLLRKVGINGAMSTIIAVESIDDVKRISAAIAMIDPAISVIARVSTEAEKSEVDSFSHELVLDGNTSTASLIVGQIQRSRLLAKESSEIRFMHGLEGAGIDESVGMIAEEQKRLLNLTSRSFNGIRNREDVMQLKAYHESFGALSEIIESAIHKLMADARLSPQQYEKINTLLDNHDRLVTMNSVLETLGRELHVLGRDDATRALAEVAVEGLDAILLTLIELAASYNEFEARHLQAMTSAQGKGFAGVRSRYLGEERNIGAETKALLLSATNHMDRLRTLFGEVGNNYRKLAGEVSN